MAGRFVRPGDKTAPEWASKLFTDDPFIGTELDNWRQRYAQNGLDAAACRRQLLIDRLQDVIVNDPQTLIAILADRRWDTIRALLP